MMEFSELVKRADDLSVTKRTILKVIAALYDPLGIVSPVLVSMKILFQELCARKVGWDEELSSEEKRRWLGWINDLRSVNEICVPRCVFKMPQGPINCSLHGFGDASNKAYCAVVYLVYEVFGAFYVTLLTSKTRVSPLKPQTTPRLELMSGRILAKLVKTVMTALKEEVELTEIRLWLDSKTVLWWINNKGEWKQFVRHRVNEILRMTRKEDWAHCPGEQNPADVGSRGARASELKEGKLWWNGPAWLAGPKDGWPTTELDETPESKEEMNKVTVTVASVTPKKGIATVIEINKFSRFSRLLRVSAWIMRFLKNSQSTRKGTIRNQGILQRDEIAEAERMWIEASQDELKRGKNYNETVRKLNLVDLDGLLKCYGRLENSDLDLASQQPIILPKDHRLTRLVIEECHHRTQHGGVRSTLGELRLRFWVPKGRQVVKKVLRECVTCKKQQDKAFLSHHRWQHYRDLESKRLLHFRR